MARIDQRHGAQLRQMCGQAVPAMGSRDTTQYHIGRRQTWPPGGLWCFGSSSASSPTGPPSGRSLGRQRLRRHSLRKVQIRNDSNERERFKYCFGHLLEVCDCMSDLAFDLELTVQGVPSGLSKEAVYLPSSSTGDPRRTLCLSIDR